MILLISAGFIFVSVLMGLILKYIECDKIKYSTISELSTIVVIHCAVGEEFVFRILPRLIANDYILTRLIISSVIFSIAHYTSCDQWEDRVKVMSCTFIMGLYLSLLEHTIESIVTWYIACCLYHVTNNLLFIYISNKNHKINPGQSNGFIMLQS